MKPVPEEKPDLHKDLSATSAQFDIGHKGFLTPAEKAARSMDFKDEGHLSNEATVHLIERTEELSKANTNLRHWLIAVLSVTVVLGASQIATAIAAARLAKDTETNSDSGVMFVKGSNKPVMVVSTGQTLVVETDSSGDTFCMGVENVAKVFASTLAGSQITGVLRIPPSPAAGDDDDEDTGSTHAVTWSATGTFYNKTQACLSSTDGQRYCFDYKPCGVSEEEMNDEGTRRLVAQQIKHHRKLFHEVVHRKLCFDSGTQYNIEAVGLNGGAGCAMGPGVTDGADLNYCLVEPCPNQIQGSKSPP